MSKIILPKSLSQFAFLFKGAKYWLAAVLVLGAVGMWFGATAKVSDDWLWLAWIATVSVILVAATPLTDDNWIGLHVSAAVLACVSVTALAAVCCSWSIAAWVGYVAYTLATDCYYKKLVAELCCVVEVICILLL